MISQRVSTKLRLPRKRAMRHQNALHSKHFTSITTSLVNYRLEATSYKSFIMIIIDLSLLTIIAFLQYTLLFVFRRVQKITANSIGCTDGFFEKMTNGNWMWQILHHRACDQPHHHHFHVVQSGSLNDPPDFRYNAGAILRSRMSATLPYFYYKIISTSDNGWIRTLRAKFRKHNTFTKPRRIGRWLSWPYYIYKEHTSRPTLEKTQQTEKTPRHIPLPTQKLRPTPLTLTRNTPTNPINSTSNSKSKPSNIIMPETDESNSSRSGHDTPPARSLRVFNIMPRPEQPGTPHFDGMNITEFLRRWNIECEDAGLTKSQKCDRFPYYCTNDIQSVVELLDVYLERNWAKLEENLKEQY